MNSKIKNRILGIIGAIIISIVAFLFQQGYIEFQKRPYLVTEEIYPDSQAIAGRDMTFTIKVHNQGEIDAINCHVYFDDGLKDPRTYSTSTVFPLVSTKEDSIAVSSGGTYPEAGNYTISAYTQCSNSNPSNPIVRTLVVSSGFK